MEVKRYNSYEEWRADRSIPKNKKDQELFDKIDKLCDKIDRLIQIINNSKR